MSCFAVADRTACAQPVPPKPTLREKAQPPRPCKRTPRATVAALVAAAGVGHQTFGSKTTRRRGKLAARLGQQGLGKRAVTTEWKVLQVLQDYTWKVNSSKKIFISKDNYLGQRLGSQQALTPSWEVPENYQWGVSTQENYTSNQQNVYANLESCLYQGPLASARRLVDMSYHGRYTVERQIYQDRLVLEQMGGKGISRNAPLLVFTAGALGVGKSYVIETMAKEGVLPLDEFVHLNPDRMAGNLPEWNGYEIHDHSHAGLMTRREAGLLTELGLLHALRQRRNILVDSSLRHGAWYSSVLKKLRKQLPDVVVAVIYVHAREETVHKRAMKRGLGGRAVSRAEVQDSLQKMPLAIQKVLDHADVFVQIANDEGAPKVTSVCHTSGRFEAAESRLGDETDNGDDGYCEVIDPESSQHMRDIGWSAVRSFFRRARGGQPASPLPEPPQVLPRGSSTSPQPSLLLLNTMVVAATKHLHQTRKNLQRTPYINHPLAVARILAETGIRDLTTLQAALLHDTLEDTDATRPELEALFGREVGELVNSLTDDDSLRPNHRKLVQLRSAQSLPLKAKLVRIADKLHNVWDIIHQGIPGWSKSRMEQYIAWACEIVSTLAGTHKALEARFHNEVSLPPGYKLGDWESIAKQQELGGCIDSWTRISSIPSQAEEASASGLAEPRGVLSLLLAAEFVARSCPSNRSCTLLNSLKLAQLLAQRGVHDPETLQAALLCCSAAGSDDAAVLKEFGAEVMGILHTLRQPPSVLMPHKAKVVLLGQHLLRLQELQVGHLKDFQAEQAFVEVLEEAKAVRVLLGRTHAKLEQGLDEAFTGQVRLANGSLTSSDLITGLVPASAVEA